MNNREEFVAQLIFEEMREEHALDDVSREELFGRVEDSSYNVNVAETVRQLELKIENYQMGQVHEVQV